MEIDIIYTTQLKKNINKEFVYTFLSNFNLISTVWMLYLAYKGMSLTQIGILEGIFHITSFLMEVPTGAIADIFGRKTSRTLGRIMWVISNITMLYGNSFYNFAIAMSLMALSYNLESGAGQALIYDSLKEIKHDNEYMKIAGKIELITQIGMISGYVLGGYVAKIKYELVFIYVVILGLITIIQSLTFKEPKIKEEHQIKSLKAVFINAYESLKYLKNRKDVLYLIFFIEGIFVIGTTLFFYLQNYFLSIGFNQFEIGIIMAISGLFSATMSYFTHKIEKRIGLKIILMILPLVYSLLSFGLVSKIPYIFNISMSGIIGILFIVYNDFVNKNIPSEKRATILSMCSMVYSFYMIIIFPLFGKLADMFSFKGSFRMLSIVILIFSIINVVINLKSEKIKYISKK
ncbi:MAG: MFS transporter [Thermosipho sp. (in: Bacteria)]|nr:MFS transporter [Thermosipho sp. (in: thermotogales)]